MINSIPNSNPLIKKSDVQDCAKIISSEETPQRLKEIMNIARKIGHNNCEKSWNNFCKLLKNEIKDDISGNDALSIFSTSLVYYISTWIILSKKLIVYQDDTGIEMDSIIKNTFDGVKKLIETAKY